MLMPRVPVLLLIPVLLSGAAVATPAAAQNLVINPDFDSSLFGWTVGKGVWSPVDADGEAGSGSLLGVADAVHTGCVFEQQARQCLPATPGQTYDIGVRAMIPPGQETRGIAFYFADWMSGPDCDEYHSDAAYDGVGAPGAWYSFADKATAPSGVQSLLFAFFGCKGDEGGTYHVQFDDAFVCPEGTCDAPESSWITSPEYPGFRFRVTLRAGEQVIHGRAEPDCLAETVCVSGALPGRSEVYLRVLGPRPNGYLWPTIVRFTPSEVLVEIEYNDRIRTYELDAVPPGVDELSGLQDRTGFLP